MAVTFADVRAQVLEEGLTARSGWPPLGRALVCAAAYAAVAVVAASVDRWWAWLPAWWVLGFLLLGAGGVVHEAVHGNLTDRAWRNQAGQARASAAHRRGHAGLLAANDQKRWAGQRPRGE